APFTLLVNQTALVDFTLAVGQVTQTVNVEATATTLQAASSDLNSLVPNKDVVNLPLNGRNFTQLLTLTPGASPVIVSQQVYGWGFPAAAQSAVDFPSM